MRNTIMSVVALALMAAGCGKNAETEVSSAAGVQTESPRGAAAAAAPSSPARTAETPLTPGMKLFMDVHHLGAGKVTAEAVAGAHQKDLAVGPRHNVRYLRYWLDLENGTVMCLSEAPNKEAALAVHQEAHGLIPDSIEEVSEGR
jgi:hypothetical protein